MRIRKSAFAGIVVMSLALAGCDALGRATPDQTIGVHEDDPIMNAAKAEARSTLPEFWERLAKPSLFETAFALKYDLNHGHPERGDAELIWAGNVQKKKDGRIVARLDNAPVTQGFVVGQMVVIPEEAIVDWQIEREGKLDGHYTTRILLSQMDAETAQMVQEKLW